MFNVIIWLDEVKKRRKEMAGKESFHELVKRALNKKNEEVNEEVVKKIAENRKNMMKILN